MLVWNVKYFDCNAQVIRDLNVLRHYEDFIKKQKKRCINKKEFSDALEVEFRWRFWSRSEYELVLEVIGDRIILKPWSGCREPIKASIDITDDPTINWLEFAECHIDRQIYRDRAKFDIWHQLRWRWEDFVNYCWQTRLPYERDHPKFHEA